MAKGRSAANLAGLAALGALGYKLYGGGKGSTSGAPVEDRVGTSASRSRADDNIDVGGGFNPASMRGRQEDNIDVGGGFIPGGLRINEETSNLYDPSGRAAAPAARPAASAAPAARAAAPATRFAEDEGFAGRRASGQAPLAYTRTDRPKSIPENAKALSRVPMKDSYQRTGRPESISEAAAALSRVPTSSASANKVSGSPERPAAPRPKPVYETPYDRMNRENRIAAAARSTKLNEDRQALKDNLRRRLESEEGGMKRGGAVKAKAKKMASGGSVSSASKRADGIASRGKTKCKMY
jgi:hypothetical protein